MDPNLTQLRWLLSLIPMDSKTRQPAPAIHNPMAWLREQSNRYPFWNTPLIPAWPCTATMPWCGLSLAELLMGRRIWTDVLQVIKTFIPQWSYSETLLHAADTPKSYIIEISSGSQLRKNCSHLRIQPNSQETIPPTESIENQKVDQLPPHRLERL